MLFTLSYRLSRYFCKSTFNTSHYFFKNQSTLLIIGSFIYFLLITINILKSLYRFIYLFVSIDLYFLHKEITKDNITYNLNTDNSILDIDGYLNSKCGDNNDFEGGGIKDKLEKLAGLVYEYFARKRKISINNQHEKHGHKYIHDNMKNDKYKKKNTKKYTNYKPNINTKKQNINNITETVEIGNIDINTKIKENYEPDIIKLRDMMTHTVDNIHDN